MQRGIMTYVRVVQYMGVLFGLGQHLPREKEKEKEKKSKRIEGPTSTTSGTTGTTSSAWS
jgi:hypothetical protein